jgi:hypothetical protein
MSEGPAAASVAAAPPQRSWWPFAGAIGLAVVVGAALLGSYGIVVYKLRHSNAGRAALIQLHASPQLRELLGEPLKLHIESGELAHEGQASFELQVRGPKGSASLAVESRAENHAWRVVRGTITFPDQRTLALDPAEAPAPPKSLPTSGSPTPAPGARGPQP